MKKRTKNLLSLGAVSLGLCLVSGFNLLNANATEPSAPDFAMGKVAEVRLGNVVDEVDKTGVRFNLFMANDTYAELSTEGAWNEGVSVGALVMPSDLLGEDALELDTQDVVNIPLYANMWRAADEDELEEAGITEGEYMTSYAVLYNVPEVCLDWELTAVGYIDPTTVAGDTVYTENSCKRSMAQVALAAIEAGEDEDALDKYLPTYEVTFMQGENVVKSSFVKYGSLASLGEVEVTPSAGKVLGGWIDENGELFDLSTPVTSDLTLTPVELSVEEALVFDDAYSLAMVESATTKEIVQDGDKKVLSATFGGSDVLKINLGSIYKIFGINHFEIVYSVEQTDESNKVEVWLNNLGGSIIWDKSTQFDTVDGGAEYKTLGVYGSGTVIDKDADPTLECVILKSAAPVSIKIEKIRLIPVWEGYMKAVNDFTGNPEFVLADFTDVWSNKQLAKAGSGQFTFEEGVGTTINNCAWTNNRVDYKLPEPVKASEFIDVHFYFDAISEDAVIQPYFVTVDGKVKNYWLSGRSKWTATEDGGYKFTLTLSKDYQEGTFTADSMIKSVSVSMEGQSQTVLMKKITVTKASYNYVNFHKQIGTNEYLLADFADPEWEGAFTVHKAGAFKAVRDDESKLTGYEIKVSSWGGAGAVYMFNGSIEYSKLLKLNVYYDVVDAAPKIAIYFIDEVGNYYWNAGSYDSTTGATWGKWFGRGATDTNPANDAGANDTSVHFGDKKIVGIAIVCSDGNTYTPVITKITYMQQ